MSTVIRPVSQPEVIAARVEEGRGSTIVLPDAITRCNITNMIRSILMNNVGELRSLGRSSLREGR
jgi:hypothetical protein